MLQFDAVKHPREYDDVSTEMSNRRCRVDLTFVEIHFYHLDFVFFSYYYYLCSTKTSRWHQLWTVTGRRKTLKQPVLSFSIRPFWGVNPCLDKIFRVFLYSRGLQPLTLKWSVFFMDQDPARRKFQLCLLPKYTIYVLVSIHLWDVAFKCSILEL